EWAGLSHQFQADLTLPADATLKCCRIVPEGTPREVFSAVYSRPEMAVVQFFWNVGVGMRWVTEGLGVYYGVGESGELWSLVFERVLIGKAPRSLGADARGF
ncbi:MAG TPA: hypothetical protein VEI97_08435, partial [bacterium]|nr:hypothetical protein [bacterium]